MPLFLNEKKGKSSGDCPRGVLNDIVQVRPEHLSML